MSRIKKLLLIFLLVIVSLLIFSNKVNAVEEIMPSITVDKTVVEFGTVGYDTTTAITKCITVTNIGEVPITIDIQNDFSQGLFSSYGRDKTEVYNPGESVTLRLVIPVTIEMFGNGRHMSRIGDFNGTYVIKATSTEDESAITNLDVPAHLKVIDGKGYVIRFYYRGGSFVDDGYVFENSTVPFPQNPDFGNQVTDKWYTDSNYENEFDETTIVNSNLDLYSTNGVDITVYVNNPYAGKVYTGGAPERAKTEYKAWYNYNLSSPGSFRPLAINGFEFKEWRLGSVDGPVIDTTDSSQQLYYSKKTQEVYFKLNRSYVLYAIFEDTGVVVTPTVSYRVKILNEGWHDWVQDGTSAMRDIAGNLQQAMEIKIDNPTCSGSIKYSVHVENVGWMPEVKDGELAGIENTKLRTEALKINLTDELAEKYDVYYRTHVQNNGWMSWAKNGEASGSSGAGLRIEGIQIKIVKKGEAAPECNPVNDKDYPFHEQVNVMYSAHIENRGDVGLDNKIRNGIILGEPDKHLRMEGITIKSESTTEGSIEYTTHVQNVGWLDEVDGAWNKSGEFSGRKGLGLRLEAIKIKLTGELAEKYSVYYRVYSEKDGKWLDWAKDGMPAGSQGFGSKLEALQIKILVHGDPNEPEVGPNALMIKE